MSDYSAIPTGGYSYVDNEKANKNTGLLITIGALIVGLLITIPIVILIVYLIVNSNSDDN